MEEYHFYLVLFHLFSMLSYNRKTSIFFGEKEIKWKKVFCIFSTFFSWPSMAGPIQFSFQVPEGWQANTYVKYQTRTEDVSNFFFDSVRTKGGAKEWLPYSGGFRTLIKSPISSWSSSWQRCWCTTEENNVSEAQWASWLEWRAPKGKSKSAFLAPVISLLLMKV